jgi:hypothetical protein
VQFDVRPIFGAVGVFGAYECESFDSAQQTHRPSSFRKVLDQILGSEHCLLTQADRRFDREMDAMGVNVILQIVAHTQVADDRNLWMARNQKDASQSLSFGLVHLKSDELN